MKEIIKDHISETIKIFSNMQANQYLHAQIEQCAAEVYDTFKRGNKLLLAGNGGSAADAQHIAGEFISRFNYDRPGLCALALTVDSSVMTAIGNDYGYERIFQRQIQAIGAKGDIFWAYSTSGSSPNVLLAMEEARERGLFVIGFTGSSGWTMPNLCNISIKIPSKETPKIQEAHLMLGHIICGIVESEIFPQP